MPSKPAKTTNNKIMDVARPGTTAADPSGRPLIVTHRAVLKDPMVVDDSSDEMTFDEPKLVAPSVTKIKIEPLHGDEPIDAQTTGSKVAPSKAEPTAPTIADLAKRAADRAKNAAETESEPEKPQKITISGAPKVAKSLADKTLKDEAPEPKEAAPPDSVEAELEPKSATDVKVEAPEPEPAGTDTKSQEAPGPEEVADGESAAESEGDKGSSPIDKEFSEKAKQQMAAEEKHRTVIDKLVEAGTYTLPINAVEKRRFRRVAIGLTILLLLVGVVWVDLALDAQLITIKDIKAPTHFFPDR